MLGRWGVAGSDLLRERSAGDLSEVLAGLESSNIGTIWFGENVGGEAFSSAGVLLARSTSIVVAPGVANMAARTPAAMAAGRRILGEAYCGRFALGIGVSHASIVMAYGGTPGTTPVQDLADYLDAMDATPGGPGAAPAPVLISALGPRMVELAASRGLGIHAWNVTPEHTAMVRVALGSAGLVAPRQAVMLSGNARIARAAGRRHLSRYLVFPNYRRAWLRQGFGERDFDGEASDRLVDAMVAWGPTSTVLDRLGEHHAAGADHVAIHALAHPDASAADTLLELAAVLPA